MRPEKRRAGRAIRKQRREAQLLLSSWAWMSEYWVQVAEAFAKAVDQMLITLAERRSIPPGLAT